MPNLKATDLQFQYDRRAYMDHENTAADHQTYHRQFATPRVIQTVADVIGRDLIVASTDPYFNDIPLGRWDSLAKGTAHWTREWHAVSNSNASTEKTGTPWHSLSDRVCVLKAAAAMIREGLA